jgi:signal transduction histidine kinase
MASTGGRLAMASKDRLSVAVVVTMLLQIGCVWEVARRQMELGEARHAYLPIIVVSTFVLTDVAFAGALIVTGKRRDGAEPMEEFRDRLMRTHEAHRTRIARQLHDDIGQRVAVLTMELDGLSDALPPGTTDLRTRIQALSARTLGLAKDIQALSHAMHSSKLDYLGLVSASAALCREASDEQHVEVDFRSDDVPERVPQDVALAIFRVLQEAVDNAVTHADVAHVSVALRSRGDDIELEVVDRGLGFDPKAPAGDDGLGLITMRERVRLVRGELVVDSRPGGGTTIRARVPIRTPM